MLAPNPPQTVDATDSALRLVDTLINQTAKANQQVRALEEELERETGWRDLEIQQLRDELSEANTTIDRLREAAPWNRDFPRGR